ncbi:hypothetical protein GALLN_00359 [Gallionellaceae bacterium]|nr:hypothetical protein GALLN_00359 [Gallionellaceae bacterium]
MCCMVPSSTTHDPACGHGTDGLSKGSESDNSETINPSCTPLPSVSGRRTVIWSLTKRVAGSNKYANQRGMCPKPGSVNEIGMEPVEIVSGPPSGTAIGWPATTTPPISTARASAAPGGTGMWPARTSPGDASAAATAKEQQKSLRFIASSFAPLGLSTTTSFPISADRG